LADEVMKAARTAGRNPPSRDIWRQQDPEIRDAGGAVIERRTANGRRAAGTDPGETIFGGRYNERSVKMTSSTTCKIGTIGEFAAWTKRTICDPKAPCGVPKKWFDIELAVAQAARLGQTV
jgi:hypothetical protein